MKSLIQVLVISVLVVACGRDESSSSVRSVSSASAIEDGSYVSGCLFESENNYMIVTSQFKNSKLNSIVDYYSEKGCSKSRYMNVTLVMDYSFSARADGGYNADYTIVAETMTLSTEALVITSNSEVFFGYKDWKVDVAKDITSKVDGDTEAYKAGEKLYGIIKQADSNTILVGNTDDGSDGTTEAKRPSTYSSNARIKK